MNFEQIFTSKIVEFEQLNADWVTLSTDVHKQLSQGLATMCVDSIH